MNAAVERTGQGRHDLVATLQSSLYPGADFKSVEMVIGYCEVAGLDPMTKPVHIVPMWDKVAKKMRDVVMPGIELYRVRAARTNSYLGITKIEYGPEVEYTFGRGDGKVTVNVWQWVEVTVSRLVGGHVAQFPSGRVFWRECYGTANRDTDVPNAMWLKRGHGQHEKCAEALALRRGFPEVGAQPTFEEMVGRELDEVETTTVQVEQPKAVTHDPAPTIPAVRPEQKEAQPTAPEAQAPDVQAPPPDTTPASPGMQRIATAKMSNAGVTPEAFSEKWGYSVETMPACDVNAVLKWIDSQGKA